MKRRTSLRAVAGAASALMLALAGCTVPPRTSTLDGPRWSGRLSLQVEGNTASGFTASFDLRGSARAGELELFTPIGSSAALLQWVPGRATLRAPGQPPREAPSLDTLVSQATGTAIPVAALFDWLDGLPTVVDGWQADLSQRPAGRLRARRLTAPVADLRVILEMP